MDANGNRFQLLLTQEDWGRCLVDDVPLSSLWRGSPPAERIPVIWDPAAEDLTLQTLLFRFVAAPADVKPAPESRRGAAADRFGNRYWIDPSDRHIRVQSVGSGRSSIFWPATAPSRPARHGDFESKAEPGPEPQRLAGLAVTEDHYLVAGVVEPQGLLIFDLYAGGPPMQLFWPPTVRFEPFDMAARPGGGVWILDRRNARYWGLDRRFCVLCDEQRERTLAEAAQDTFQPLDAEGTRVTVGRTFPEGIEYDAASPVEAIDAFSIEALADGTVLILDRDAPSGFSRVLRYRYARRLGEPVSMAPLAGLIEEDEREGFTLVAHDFAFLPCDAKTREPDRLMVASSEGNQAFALILKLRDEQLTLEPVRKYFPMRRFGGKGLLVSGGTVYYDFGEGWIPLKAQGRPRYGTRAELVTQAFDSGAPDCVWHRLMLDACIPPETSVEVWSRAANRRADLSATRWHREPVLYGRGDGTELPWLPRRDRHQIESAHQAYRTWELLFQQARGRFMQLKLVLAGNERATPRLSALRAWYPRFSYVENYLPAVYREDPGSGSFLDRFLANFEGFYTALEDRIANIQALFDWRSAPAETLDWLAGWFEVSLDPAWDEHRRRLFIKRAMDFFQFRGTLHGVRMALALALDPTVEDCDLEAPGRIPESRQRFRLIERFLTRRTPGRVLGEPLRDVGPREVTVGARWTPQEGGARLAQRYAEYLEKATGSAMAVSEFPLLAPAKEAEAARWHGFAEQALGFVPSATEEPRAWRRFLSSTHVSLDALNEAHASAYASFEDVPLPRDLPTNARARHDWRKFVALAEPAATVHARRQWQGFLGRRYRRIGALNEAYGKNWTGFEEVVAPERVPKDGAPLADWYQYETVVKAMHRHAHRFSVLIPTPGPGADPREVEQRLALARRVVELEKPAHTVFDVGFYWAMFRIGEARLGFDTLLDVGSRAPQLLPPFVLGKGYVGAAYLAAPPGHPGKERLTLDGVPVMA